MNVSVNVFDDLKIKFEEIKKMGWVKSCCKGLGGIGNTLEELIGLNRNDFEIPDYFGVEIKTKRAHSGSNTCLFSCVPDGPHYHEVERLKDEYGYPDSMLKMYNVLNTTLNTKIMKKVGLYYYFKLKVDRTNEKLLLEIYDKNKVLIENEVYWDFDTLKEKLYRKLKYMAFFKAYIKEENGWQYFKYYKLNFYKLKGFETLINLIEDGTICVTFRLGIYRAGDKKGKIYDHGTSFNINEYDFWKLYDDIKI